MKSISFSGNLEQVTLGVGKWSDFAKPTVLNVWLDTYGHYYTYTLYYV